MSPRAPLPRYVQAFALAALAYPIATSRAAVPTADAPAPAASSAAPAPATLTLRLSTPLPPAASASGSAAASASGTAPASSSAAPASAPVLELDGAPAALDVPLEVAPGRHVVRCSLPGRAPFERHVTLVAGERRELLVDAIEPEEPRALGGVPPRVRSRGCGSCGGSHDDYASTSLGGGAFALGLVLAAARRRPRR